MVTFNYSAPAEFFIIPSRINPTRNKGRSALRYRRFDSGAEAVRFVVEDVPSVFQAGIVLESDDGRFDHLAVRALYESAEYPLTRNVHSH